MIDGHLAHKLTPELLLVHCRPSSANFQATLGSTLNKILKKKRRKNYSKKERRCVSNKADFQLGEKPQRKTWQKADIVES
ncbi:hypothetical protein KR038_007560 [Drosophila bunnanda]|nr:hypothetical protein KR038_007560 [Drosophila bunnanda]